MKNVFLICVGLIFALTAKAQNLFFSTHTLGVNQEKSNIKVGLQDQAGYIWWGTDAGLFRYDGFSLVAFSLAQGLPTEKISALAQDAEGKIWIGHPSGEISFFHNNRFHTFNPPEGTPKQEISDIVFDKEGNLWFSTLNEGLYIFRKDRLYQLDEEDGMPDMFVYDLEVDNAGNVWAGTDGGIAICSWNTKPVVKQLNQKSGLPDNIVRKIHFVNDSIVLLGTQDVGVVKLNTQTTQFEILTSAWTHGPIFDLVHKDNEIWITGSQKDVWLLDADRQVQNFSLHHPASILLKDGEEGIWVTGQNAFSRTQGSQVSWLETNVAGGAKEVVAVAVDENSKIWFSNQSGLFQITSGSGSPKQITGDFQNPPVISLYADRKGSVWAGTFGGGLFQLNLDGSVKKHFKKELPNGNILGISGSGNDIWLATLEGATRVRKEGANWQITKFSRQQGLASDYIYQVFVDKSNRVWLATDGKDIDMIDDKGVHHYKVGDGGKVVFAFAEDENQTIWANVQNEGIYYLDKNQFRSFQENKQANTMSLAVNKFGEIVSVQETGIEVFNSTTKAKEFFGRESGMSNRKPFLNAIAQDANRNLYIGTNDGIVKYHAGHQLKNIRPRPFVQMAKAARDTIYDKTQLAYDHNDVAFKYVGFWFRQPDDVTYQYKLENFNKDWITTRDAEVTFPQLPPGNYVFHLRASVFNDFNASEDAVFAFTIVPPFWKRAWFYLLTIILAGGGVMLFVKVRERNLQRERQTLKFMVDERTKELQMRNEEIQAQSEELQAQAAEIKKINDNLEKLVEERTNELEKKNKALEEYAFINAHKLRSPLASILGLVNLMKILPHTPESKECAQKLDDSAKILDDVVSSITQAIQKADNK